MRAILPYYGWKICCFIPGIQNFHHTFGRAVGTDWLLGKASILPKRTGNARFELQIGNVLMVKMILSICMVFSLKSNTTLRQCKVSLPIMRSYIGTWSPRFYSTISS